MIADQTEAERAIVVRVSSLVGPYPIVLVGSRATGEATPESDYDVYVVLPNLRVLRSVRGLRSVADGLSADLGVTVTLNPLPAFRLDRPGHTLIVWKLRREGRVLAPSSFRLGAPGEPPHDDVAVASYALSGLRYLVEDLEPHWLGEPRLPPAVSARTRKALLHAAQIELLGEGRYDSSLAAVIGSLPSVAAIRFTALESAVDRPETWFAVRDLLITDVGHPSVSISRKLALNMQYVLLRTLRTRRPVLRPLLTSQSIPDQLGRALVALTLAVEPGAEVDDSKLRRAVTLLPEKCEPTAWSWSTLRDRIDASWADAHPLVGF